MKRLLIIALTLMVLGSMGYFATRNSHNVSLNLVGNFSIQLSLWMLMAISIVSGWAATELWHFFLHPDRFVRSFLGKISKFRKSQQLKKEKKFEKAFLLKDPKQVKKSFRKLVSSETSLNVRLQFLEQQRYVLNGESLLDSYAELKEEIPDNLQVLLAFLKLSCELKKWELTEKNCQEILKIAPEHPDAIEALRQMHQDTNNWVACVEQERELLKKFSGSLITEKILLEHENHLQLALRQNPKCLNSWSFRYLPQKRDKRNDKLSEVIGEVTELKKAGNLINAAQVLKNSYERMASLELLMMLETLYYESGADAVILSLIASLHRSRQSTIPSSLLFAKLLFQNNRIDESSHVLGEISLPVIASPQALENSEANKNINPLLIRWSRIYHAIKYLIAVRQEHPEDALQEAGQLLLEEKLLESIADESH